MAALAAPILSAAGVGLWPFTTWELFSRVREPGGVTWRVSAVDATGDEQPIDLGSAGSGLSGWFHQAKRIDTMAPDRAAEICAAWLEAARSIDPGVTALQVYRLRTEFRPTGERVDRVLTERTLTHRCEP